MHQTSSTILKFDALLCQVFEINWNFKISIIFSIYWIETIDNSHAQEKIKKIIKINEYLIKLNKLLNKINEFLSKVNNVYFKINEVLFKINYYINFATIFYEK